MPNRPYPDGGWQSMIFSSDHGSRRQHAYRLLLFLNSRFRGQPVAEHAGKAGGEEDA